MDYLRDAAVIFVSFVRYSTDFDIITICLEEKYFGISRISTNDNREQTKNHYKIINASTINIGRETYENQVILIMKVSTISY